MSAFQKIRNGMGSMGRILSIGIRTSAIVHLTMNDFVEIGLTDGESMLPTLETSRDYVWVDKTYKYGRGIAMGDVIVAKKPTVYNESVCKRITGMPGDIILLDPSVDSVKQFTNQVTLENGNVDVSRSADDNNTSDIKEINIVSNTSSTSSSYNNKSYYDQYIIVPEGHCWVTGDNLSSSLDSRSYSAMPLGLIQGKLKYAYQAPKNFFEFNDLRKLNNNFHQEL